MDGVHLSCASYFYELDYISLYLLHVLSITDNNMGGRGGRGGMLLVEEQYTDNVCLPSNKMHSRRSSEAESDR